MKKFVVVAIVIVVLFVLSLLTACGTAPSSQMKAGYGTQFVSTQIQNEIVTI